MPGRMQRQTVIAPDAEKLAEAAVERIAAAAAASIKERGRFTIALTGGTTPEKAYSLLARPEHQSKVDWSKTIIFVGDERFVPLDDPRSNYGMAKRTMLDHVPISDNNLYPVQTDLGTPAEAATAYILTLTDVFQEPGGKPPRFDLILLGLGSDGHIASLFPHAPALDESKAWVTWSPPGTLPPPVDRVTFTYPLINAARSILFLVSGAGKAEVVTKILNGAPDWREYPAVGVGPSDGTVTWLVDTDAYSSTR